MITAIKTRIDTNKFERTLEFYVNTIGLSVVEKWPGDKQGAILGNTDKNGSGFLEIGSSDKPAGVRGITIQIRVKDIEGFVSRLADDAKFRGPVERPWGSKYVYLDDPNGIGVIVFEGEV